jgi:tetratricopeptide (TPR) repeat protein
LRYLQESLAITRAVGDRAGEGTTLNNIAAIYQDQGDYGTALRYLQESLAIMRAIGNRAGLCTTLFNIGHIHLAKQEREQAIASFVAAYRIAKQIGYAQVLSTLDNLAKQMGGTGLEYWEKLAQQLPSTEAGES